MLFLHDTSEQNEIRELEHAELEHLPINHGQRGACVLLLCCVIPATSTLKMMGTFTAAM